MCVCCKLIVCLKFNLERGIMLGGSESRVRQKRANACVWSYLRHHLIDLHEACIQMGERFPDTYLRDADLYRDYVNTSATYLELSVEVSFAQFVRALRRYQPTRCFYNKHGSHVLTGYKFGKEPVA